MEQVYREVNFGKYCKTCKYSHKLEYDDPCDECLSYPTNLYSEKPINWKEKSREN